MVALIIPARNGGVLFQDCLAAIAAQSLQPDSLLLMDSGSTDDTAAHASAARFRVEPVPEGTFDHGGTRARAVELVTDEIVVMMTQDAVLDGRDSLARLVAAFDDPKVAAAYGRQLPHVNASPLAAHARRRNYGTQSYVTSMDASFPAGIRKAYMSNSFAAYRRKALIGTGNFEPRLIFGEDFLAAGRLLKAGHRLAYIAEARVRHSHNLSIGEEFRRYFDIGVFHATQPWLLRDFGTAGGEGIRFALGQLGELAREGHWAFLPRSALSSAAKFAGYRLGRRHKALGPHLSRRLAMNRAYFARL